LSIPCRLILRIIDSSPLTEWYPVRPTGAIDRNQSDRVEKDGLHG